jgi:hypothetical protein
MQPDPADLRALIDRHQIAELLYTYCRAVDRIDTALGYTVFHDGAAADYGRIYQGDARGLIDYICASHQKAIVHSHQITNVIIKLDGDAARSEAYITSAMRLVHEGQLQQITTRGRYLDRWSRRNGRWGVDHRFFACDFDEIRPVTSAFVPPRFSLDRTDPSYALFDGAL